MAASYDELYARLRATLREAAHLYSAKEHLYCDMVTGMPVAASDSRNETVAYLTTLRHRLLTSPEYGDLARELGAMVDSDAANPQHPDRHIIMMARKDYLLESKVPAAFVEAQSRVNTEGYQVWMRAHPAGDWQMFLPAFTEVVRMAREYADIIGHAGSPYDVYLDRYDPGLTAVRTAEILDGLVEPLSSLVQRIGASAHPLRRMAEGSWNLREGVQETVARKISRDMGFDYSAGRLMRTQHPFCDHVCAGDTWLALGYDRKNPADAIMSLVHEAGHGMNAQKMPLEYFGTPFGTHRSYSLSESQSRLWEVMIGTSRPFCEYLHGLLKRMRIGRPTVDRLVSHLNVVTPSFIRIQADEVTYGLHIYTRFKSEWDLLERKLEPKDVPEKWAADFERLLGLKITKDADGPLQDAHWADGSFGYFPSYTVGNIYGAHFRAALRRDLRDMDNLVRRGDFAPITDWLTRHVYVHGGLFSADMLVELATGMKPNAKVYTDYMDEKFTELYRL